VDLCLEEEEEEEENIDGDGGYTFLVEDGNVWFHDKKSGSQFELPFSMLSAGR
jgi:hypothetical protein